QDSTIRACDQPATRSAAAAFYGHLNTLPAKDTGAIGVGYMADVLEAIRESLRPNGMSLNAYLMEPGSSMLSGETTVLFTAPGEGKVRDLGLASSSLAAEFDRALYDAVRRVDSSGVLPPIPQGGPSRVRFYLTMYAAPYPDTAKGEWKRHGLVKPL